MKFWDKAYFFASPNSYQGGAKPMDVLLVAPDKLSPLAERFVNPATVF
jgi:hypothetical protein